MEETRGEQVAFGWAGEGATDSGERPADARHSTPRPRRGRDARAERENVAAVPAVATARAATSSLRAEEAAPRRRSTRTPTVDAPLPPDDELWDVLAAARFLKRTTGGREPRDRSSP